LFGSRRITKKKISGYTVPVEIVYKDVDLDGDGYVYILAGHFSENPSRDIYVLDPGGNLITKFALPNTSHCIHINERGHLFSRKDAGVTLKKYRIHMR
jgi:hypothetical protein